MENGNKTAEGLRDRLFMALDGIIDGSMNAERVQAVCFVSEQIINTAKHELAANIAYSDMKKEEAKTLAIATNNLTELIHDSEGLGNE